MLIFISDLHFDDGSAGEHNVPAEAFRIFLDDIGRTAKRLRAEKRKIREIKIVFLGDIFDLLRTEAWFQYPESERPWGNDEAKTEQHAGRILDAIVEKNREAFDLLGSELKSLCRLPVEPERIFVPGNHDRLCNRYASLRNKVREALRIDPSDMPFAHSYLNPVYGVFSRHGHEYDKFNYEGGISHGYEDYMRVPIGEPIATELVARLPWKVMQSAAVKGLPEDERTSFRRNLEEIENVRPLSAILEWLLYQVKKHLRLKNAIEDAVDTIVQEFDQLRYVETWYRHHDRWRDFWDEADKVQAFLFLLEKFKVFQFEKLMPLLEKVKLHLAKDDLLEAASSEYKHLDADIRYVVYGHTHEPRLAAVRRSEGHAAPREQVYLNTGTWRARFHRCAEGLGFIGWKNMTYVTFYTREERGKDFPAFETWTGTLKSI